MSCFKQIEHFLNVYYNYHVFDDKHPDLMYCDLEDYNAVSALLYRLAGGVVPPYGTFRVLMESSRDFANFVFLEQPPLDSRIVQALHAFGDRDTDISPQERI